MSSMINVLPTGRQRRLPRRSVTLGAVALVAVTGGGIAYAAWSVSATGSSQATSGTPVVGTVAVATPVASLYPGGSTPVYFTVTNPNSFPVTYTAASFGTVTVDGDASTCPPATYITTANQAVSVSLAAGATSTVQSPAGAISMTNSAPDGCQGRTFTVATTLTGTSG
jgi:hypothetical protein